jgi:hypothetical protein
MLVGNGEASSHAPGNKIENKNQRSASREMKCFLAIGEAAYATGDARRAVFVMAYVLLARSKMAI